MLSATVAVLRGVLPPSFVGDALRPSVLLPASQPIPPLPRHLYLDECNYDASRAAVGSRFARVHASTCMRLPGGVPRRWLKRGSRQRRLLKSSRRMWRRGNSNGGRRRANLRWQ